MVLSKRPHRGYLSPGNALSPPGSTAGPWGGKKPPTQAPSSQQIERAGAGLSIPDSKKIAHFIDNIFKQATDVTTVVPMLLAAPLGQLGKAALMRRAVAAPPATLLGRLFNLKILPVLGGFGAETAAFALGARGLSQLLRGPVPWDPASVLTDLAMAGLTLGLLKGGHFAGSKGMQWARGLDELKTGVWTHADRRALFWTAQASSYLGLVASHGIQTKVNPRPQVPNDNIWIEALGTQLALGIGAQGGRSLLGPKLHAVEQALSLESSRLTQEARDSLPGMSSPGMVLAAAKGAMGAGLRGGDAVSNLNFMQGDSGSGVRHYAHSEKINSDYLGNNIETELVAQGPVHNLPQLTQLLRESFLDILVSGREEGFPLRGEIAEQLRSNPELRKRVLCGNRVHISFETESGTILQLRFTDRAGNRVLLLEPKEVMDLRGQVSDLQSQAEAAQAKANELREAIELSRQFEKAAGMEQRLRVTAEGRAEQYLEMIGTVQTGVAELREAIGSLQTRLKEGGRRADSAIREHGEQMSRDLAELKERLAAKEGEIETLKLKLRDAEGQQSDMDELREELSNSRAAEQAAREEATRQQEAAEAARILAEEKERLLEEIEGLRRVLNSAQETQQENVTLAREVMELKTQIQELQGQVGEAQAEAREGRAASELSRQFAKVVEMEQRLRVRAEGQANDYLQVIDAVQAGVSELGEAIASLQKKLKNGGNRVASAEANYAEEMTKELDALKERLAAKQEEVNDLKSRLLEAEEQIAEMNGIRQELAGAKAAEQAAKEEAERQREAAKAAVAQGIDRERLLRENKSLRRLLRGAREGESAAKKSAFAHKHDAAREKARADRNELLAHEVLGLREHIRELEQAIELDAMMRRRIQGILGRTGFSRSPRPSSRVASNTPDVAEAFETLDLDPGASYQEFMAHYRALVEVFHPDRLRGSTPKAQELAGESLREIIEAQKILDIHFKQNKSAAPEGSFVN